MNFSRSMILVVGTALLAACGDKVTVTQYTPPATVAKVYSVEVAPATATVTTGASLTFTSAVNADAGVATTVTWSASAGTITTAGVFTAPTTANAGIAVCATSTVDTGKKGCATVVVQAATAVVPATVSIQSITTGNLNVPVNPANVFGQIDVRLNVNPGNQTVSKVVLLVGGIRADSQTFTAAQAAAIRYAADEAIAQQTIFPQIVFSINTAAFSATTGVPSWANGTRAISAQLYTTQGGATTAATASVATSLTFNNVDTYTLSLGTLTNKNSAAGFQWSKGDVTASVLPVSYSGRILTAGSISFGTGAACDNSGVGVRTLALAAPTTGSKWTATFSSTDANGPLATNVTGYEFNPAGLGCPGIAAGEGFAVTSNDANGTILVGAAPANNPTFRVDNLAPGAVTLAVDIGNNLIPGTRTGGWVNDAASFTATVAASAANGSVAVLPADGGIGGAAATAKVGGVTMTTPAGLAESSAASNYTVSVYNCDALSNCSVNTDATFAVDRTAPTVSYGTNPANNTGYNNVQTAIPAAWVGTSVTDPATGSSLPSGFLNLGGTPLIVNQARRNPTDTRYYCPTTGTFLTAATGCVAWLGTTQNYASNIQVNTNTGVAGDAYITTNVSVADQAGNVSAIVTRVFAQDVTAATASLLAPLSLPADGSAITLSGAMADALHLRGYQADFQVAGFAPYVNTVGGTMAVVAGSTDRFFYTAPTAVDAYNPTALSTSGSFSATLPHFFAQWQWLTDTAYTAGGPYSTFGAQAPLSNVGVGVVNVGSTPFAVSTPVVAPAVVGFASGAFSFRTPTMASTGGSNTTSISRDGVCVASLGGSDTRVLSVAAIGLTTYANPFARVQFWAYQDGAAGGATTVTTVLAGTAGATVTGYSASAGTQPGLNPSFLAGNLNAGRAGWRFIGETTQATTQDNGVDRTWTYSYTWNATADQLPWRGSSGCSSYTVSATGGDAFRVIAVGVAATGGAVLVSPATLQWNVAP
jgi:hypothetical protein